MNDYQKLCVLVLRLAGFFAVTVGLALLLQTFGTLMLTPSFVTFTLMGVSHFVFLPLAAGAPWMVTGVVLWSFSHPFARLVTWRM